MRHLYIFDEVGRASTYGIGTYIRNIVSICENIFLPVTVVTLSTGEEDVSYVRTEKVRYINVPALKDAAENRLDLDDKNIRKRYCEYVVSVLQSYVSSTNSVIFHLNYTQDYFLANGLKTKWPTAKLILTIHYFSWCFSLLGNVQQLSKIVSKDKTELSDFEREVIYSGLFEQQLFNIVDNIICLSHFAEQILIGYYEISIDKLRFIQNGIEDCYRKADISSLRGKYGIPDNEKMLLYVGRLDRIKGVKYLIDAFKEVALVERNAHLYIIGDGYFSEILPLCSPIWRQITFCGRLLPEQVTDFYQMSDIGLLPSLHEQCSYVAIEMMMYGLPIIGTDTTGLNEMIVEGENGHKVHLIEKDEDIEFPVEELTSLLFNLLRLPSLEIYSNRSRNLFLQHYTTKHLQNKLCQLYTFYLKGKEVPSYQNAE